MEDEQHICPQCGGEEFDQQIQHPHEVYCESCGWGCEPCEFDLLTNRLECALLDQYQLALHIDRINEIAEQLVYVAKDFAPCCHPSAHMIYLACKSAIRGCNGLAVNEQTIAIVILYKALQNKMETTGLVKVAQCNVQPRHEFDGEAAAAEGLASLFG